VNLLLLLQEVWLCVAAAIFVSTNYAHGNGVMSEYNLGDLKLCVAMQHNYLHCIWYVERPTLDCSRFAWAHWSVYSRRQENCAPEPTMCVVNQSFSHCEAGKVINLTQEMTWYPGW